MIGYATLCPDSRNVRRHKTLLAATALIACISNGALAQIKTDSSLGNPATSLAGPNFLIPQTLGRLSGSNLFHSFETFNVPVRGSANFTTTTPNLANVISRVTGGTQSQINGLLKLTVVSGAPNFFLINPAGVTFDGLARIDVPGAFHVSTANYLKFPDGIFRADLAPGSTFSSVAPEAFGFLGTTRAPVAVRSPVRLEQTGSRALSIIAGDVEVRGQVVTEGGDIRVLALGQKAQEVALSGALPEAFGNLSLLDGGQISSATSSSGKGGSISASAGTVTIDGQGNFNTGFYSLAFDAGEAGRVEVSATGNLNIRNGGFIGSETYSSGGGGSVKVGAGNIAISQGDIFSNAYDSGNAGSVEVTAAGNISINNGTISSSTYEGATGNAGRVEVTAGGALSVVNGGEISAITFSAGNAGSVNVSAGSIVFDGHDTGIFTGIAAQAAPGSTGSAGSTTVASTGGISVLNNAAISSGTFAAGDAGPVMVEAASILIDGHGSRFFTGISSQAGPGSTGKAGSVDVATGGSLSILNGGQISSSTFSSGNGGAVKVRAGTILLDRGSSDATGISSDASGTGNAGSVEVAVAGNLSILNGGLISSGAFSAGNAGSVRVNAGSIVIDGRASPFFTGISSQAAEGSGNAGSIEVVSGGSLSILNGGAISSGTFTSGNGGSVKVSAGNIVIDGQGTVASISTDAASDSAGSAGDVEVSATGALSVINGGSISSNTFSVGNAGVVKVVAGSISVDGKGSLAGISSDAGSGSTGKAGNIEVTTPGTLSVVNNGFISSDTAGSGNAGSVNVNAGNIVIDGQGISNGISSDAAPFSAGNAGNVEVSTTGALSIINRGSISSVTFSVGDAGVVKVTAGSISIDGKGLLAGISSDAGSGSTGKAGDIEVTTPGTLSVVNNGFISSDTAGSGNAGSVKVNAGNILIDGRGISNGISSDAAPLSAGNAGNVEVSTGGFLSLVNGGSISSATFSSGAAGSVTVKAGTVRVDGSTSTINALAKAGSSGQTGSVSVSATDSITLSNAGSISIQNDATVVDPGKIVPTKVTVSAPDIAVTDAQITAASSGNVAAGNVEVLASGKLVLARGGLISSEALGPGRGGTVNASAGSILIDGQGTPTGISSAASASGIGGDAGSVDVSTPGALSISGGGSISSNTRSSGAAGSVRVNAGTVSVDGAGSSINASAEAGSSGQTGSVSVSATESITLSNAGSISIQNDATVVDPGKIVPTKLVVSAPDIALKNAQITAASAGNVPASDVQINFTNQLFLDPSSITTSANLGDGGSIVIQGGRFITLENSQIVTSVLGLTGNGGNISIHADELFLKTGFIQANTAGPNASGGLVTIDVRTLLATGGSLFLGGDVPFAFQPGVFGFNVIQAAAPTGVSGVIRLTNPILDLTGSLAGLNVQVIDAGGLGRSPCQIPGGSSLARSGRGGLPPAAGGLLRADVVAESSEVAERTAPAPLAFAFRLASPDPACF